MEPRSLKQKKYNPLGRKQDFCYLGKGKKRNFKTRIKNLKLIFNLFWFTGIFLVYAVITKVKNNIKPEYEQNLFRIGGRLSLPRPDLQIMVAQTSEKAHFIKNWEF